MPEAPPLTKGLTVGQTVADLGFLSSAIGESREYEMEEEEES